MNDPLPETNVFDVHLPKPGPRGAIAKIAAIVLGVGVIAVAVGVIINRAASPTVDPLAQIMPADTMLFLSITTHPDQQPNYAVVSNAWKGSKEAKQIESGLAVAVTYAGFDWDTDIKPWLGDRAAVGLIDLGGYDQPVTSTSSSSNFPRYRVPFFVIAVQTRDRSKSDKFLVDYRQQIDKSASSSYYTNTTHEDTYRGIPIVYQTTESSFSSVSTGQAFATINDVIVLTQGPDNLKKVIDAALDGQNLSTSSNFKTTMSALNGSNVFAFFMDFNQYLQTFAKFSSEMAAFSVQSSLAAGLDNQADQSLQQIEQRRQEQMTRLSQLGQTLGGIGMVMTYESTGLRFDAAAQFDPSQLPAEWRSLYPTNFTPASNQIFDSIPASAVIAANANLPAGALKVFLDPNYWSTVLAANPNVNSADIMQKIDEFQKAAGVDLKSDLLDLLNGDIALVLMTKTKTDASKPNDFYSFNFPFDLAALVDSSDALRTASSLDKIFGALIASSDQTGVQLQPMNRAPYTALLDKQNSILLTYGVVNNRLVIGSTPDTLDAIGAASQSPLSADPTFKEATAVLSPDRLSTGYFNLKSIWDWIASLSGGSNCTGCNYLSAFKWLSIDSQAPNNGLQHGSMHIGLQPAKTDLVNQ